MKAKHPFTPFFMLLLLCAGLLPGCALNGHNGVAGFDGVSKNFPTATSTLANDAAKHLATVYPPGQTALSINADSAFGEALEANLRQRGFTIAASGLPVGYKLDILQDESACYLSLFLPDGVITQSYELGGGGFARADNSFSKSGLPQYNPQYNPPSAPQIAPVVASLPAAYPSPTGVNPASTGANPALPASGHSPAVGTAPAMQAATTPEPAVLPLPVPLPEPSTTSHFSIWPGMLKQQLQEWANTANYTLIWKAEHDYDMAAHAQFDGEFVEAVRKLFMRMHQNGNPLKVTIYQNNRVIEVVED